MASPTHEDVWIWRARAAKVDDFSQLAASLALCSAHTSTPSSVDFHEIIQDPEEASEASSRGVRGVPRRTELAGGARSPTYRRSRSRS